MDEIKAERAPPPSSVVSKEVTNDEKGESAVQSDVESDSTIGAGRPENQENQPLEIQPSPEPEVCIFLVSRNGTSLNADLD